MRYNSSVGLCNVPWSVDIVPFWSYICQTHITNEKAACPAAFFVLSRDTGNSGRIAIQRFVQHVAYLGQVSAQRLKFSRGQAHCRILIVWLILPLAQTVAGTGNGEAFFIQQIADAPNEQDLVVLIVAPVASSLQGFQLGELLLPVAQHMRLDQAEIGDLANREVALGWNGRKMIRGCGGCHERVQELLIGCRLPGLLDNTAQLLAGMEGHHPAGVNENDFAGLGIATRTRGLVAHLEITKAGQLDFVSTRQGFTN